MDIEVSSPIPDTWYENSGILRPLRGQSTLQHVVKNIKKFNRSSLIQVAEKVLWGIWNNPGLERTGHRATDEAHFLAKRYGDAVVLLSAIYSPNSSGSKAKEVDFRILVAEFSSIPDSIANERWKLETEIPRARSRIAAYLNDTPLKQIPPTDFGKFCADLFRVRLSDQQWQGYSFYESDWTRAWLIYEELRTLALGIHGADLPRFEQQYLGTSYERFIRSAWVLYAVISRNSANSPTPGHFDLDKMVIPPEFTQKFGITNGDFNIVSTRLSEAMSTYPSFSSEIENTPDPIKKHAEPLDRLAVKPIIIMGGKSSGWNRILVPSPWKMLAAIRRFLLHEFVDAIAEREGEILAKRSAYSLRGEAFSQYLRKIFRSRPDLVDLDGVDCQGGKKPDFLWKGRRYAVLMEAKYRLRPNKDRICLEPGTLVETWETALEAVTQAAEFLKNPSISKTNADTAACPKKVLIIVTEDAIPEEVTWFKAAAKRWNWLQGTGIDSLALLTPAELEYYVFNSNADNLGSAVDSVWSHLNPDLPNPAIRDPNLFNEVRNAPLPAHILTGWNQLFPGIPLRPQSSAD